MFKAKFFRLVVDTEIYNIFNSGMPAEKAPVDDDNTLSTTSPHNPDQAGQLKTRDTEEPVPEGNMLNTNFKENLGFWNIHVVGTFSG